MKAKRKIYTETAFVLGLLFLVFGASLTEKAGFGMSMVIAPPYIIYLKISQYLPFYTFGMSAYVFQGLLIILTIIISKKFKLSYIFSFATAVVYGFLLDGVNLIAGYIPNEILAIRVILYCAGILCSTLGVAFMFKTYLPPEAYELIVIEASQKYGIETHKVKVVYDISSLVLSVLLSFMFFGFGKFNGVHIGTVVSAVANGFLIGLHTKTMEKYFVFADKFNLRDKIN